MDEKANQRLTEQEGWKKTRLIKNEVTRIVTTRPFEKKYDLYNRPSRSSGTSGETCLILQMGEAEHLRSGYTPFFQKNFSAADPATR